MKKVLSAILGRIKISSHIKKFLYLDLLGAFIGLIGGLGAIVFREMIKLNKWIFFSQFLQTITFQSDTINLSIIFIPMIGGLIVGPLVYKFAPEAKGHGVPEVMESIRIHQGRIRKRVALVKILASSITIGSGGSAGREGPIAQIGASFGSLLGDILKVGSRERKLLVVSGLSAGIAGTFNAPLGGALFGLEVLLGGFTVMNAIVIILAAAVGAAVVEAVYGPYPAFYVPSHLTFSNPIELFFYFVLGLIFGLIAIFWVKLFYFFEALYDQLKIRPYYKVAIGGFFTGLIGFLYYQYGILGVGYEGIEMVLAGSIAFSMLFILATLKMLATANTIGSGGSGGVFAPSLYIGAMYGALFGLFFNSLFPSIVKQPYTYSLVGMGALFAAAAHAPLCMIIMIPEMTNDYSLLLPMMVACSTSYIVFKSLLGDSNIYTLKLQRKGVKLLQVRDLSVFEILKVKDFMTKNVITVSPDDNLEKVFHLIREYHHDCYPVVENNKLLGVITSDDVMSVPIHFFQKCRVKDIMRKNYHYLYCDSSIRKVIEVMNSKGIGKVLIVSKENPRKLEGIFTKTDLVKVYAYISTI